MNKLDLNKITQPLLEWYRNNARDLPWRHTKDPYRIWVSEIMLQQTRVAAVLGYYDRFINELPTVRDLAQVDEERLLKLWEGLGYYSRVRNMKKAAVQVIEQFDGCFPEHYEDIISLCGIGEYTAGAIASSAFGLRVPAVDGNVLRVLSRITENGSDIADAKTKKEFRSLLFDILPETPEDMHIFNQAVMELGATVCIPNGTPKCSECPVKDFCKAHLNHTTEVYPVKSSKKARRVENMTVFVLLRDQEIALRKRNDIGLLASLWEFPNVQGVLEDSDVFAYLKRQGLSVLEWNKQLKAKHIFTHVEWHMTGYVLRVSGEGPSDFVWVNDEQFSEYALPSAFSRFTEETKIILNIQEKA